MFQNIKLTCKTCGAIVIAHVRSCFSAVQLKCYYDQKKRNSSFSLVFKTVLT